MTAVPPPPKKQPAGIRPATGASAALLLPAGVAAGGKAATAAGRAAGTLGGAAVLSGAAAGAVVEAVDAALRRAFAKLRDRRAGYVRRHARGVSNDDVDAVLREEGVRERAFETRALIRVRKDARVIADIPDARERTRRVDALLRREERYLRQRAAASAVRLQRAAERRALRRESPEGAFWELSPDVRSHTADCVAMAGRFWPWAILNRVYPPLHPGCPCALRSKREAVRRGLMGERDVMSMPVALQRAAGVLSGQLALGESVGLIVLAEMARRGDGEAAAFLAEGAPLQEADLSFDPRLHPRDAHGQFTDVLSRLTPPSAAGATTVTFPDGTRVKRDADGTLRVVRSGKITRGFRTEREAAKDALDRSARGKQPDSLGGEKSYPSFEAAAKELELGTVGKVPDLNPKQDPRFPVGAVVRRRGRAGELSVTGMEGRRVRATYAEGLFKGQSVVLDPADIEVVRKPRTEPTVPKERTFSVTFGEGSQRRTVTRRSEASYTHAAVRQDGEFGGWKVTFHKNRDSAQRAAGRFGSVYPVTVAGEEPEGVPDVPPVFRGEGSELKDAIRTHHGDTFEAHWRLAKTTHEALERTAPGSSPGADKLFRSNVAQDRVLLTEVGHVVSRRAAALRQEQRREALERQSRAFDARDHAQALVNDARAGRMLSPTPEARRAWREANEAWRKAQEEVQAAKKAVSDPDAYLVQALREARDGFGEGRFRASGSSKLRPLLVEATRHVPREWIDADRRQPALRLQAYGRGYYQHNDWKTGGALISTPESNSVMLHELGHWTEYRQPAVRTASETFYEYRTRGEELVQLSKLRPGHGYRRDEKARPDGFADPYVGKDYRGRTYETLTMGLEGVFYGKHGIVDRDPEHARWTVGVLTLL